MVKTKIICTLGPASADRTIIRKMMLAGMDIARLNFSHGTHSRHQNLINFIKELNIKYRRRIRILQDLEGYRIRIGKFKDKKTRVLKKKQIVLFTNRDNLIDDRTVLFDYPGSLSDMKVNTSIYIDDGNIALRVKGSDRNYIKTEVIIPGVLKENKGVSIPDIDLRFGALTEKDLKDLRFGIKQKVDFIAQSFVRDKQDLVNIRDIVKDSGFHPRIIAKIENRSGVKNINRILDVADGIMVARGDLGVSFPIHEVPVLQKILIKKCKQRKKMVITATQMLESMTEHIKPTRAEVSDVANAIFDGSDYLMLSAETAVGKYPVETVRMMNDVIKFTEGFLKNKRN
ncbi:MAG: pyruvate kinase [Deltaproteobacteria bacterium]|nr:MAG: pyruvate kinase [Deltaproteobacteria bacterium]